MTDERLDRVLTLFWLAAAAFLVWLVVCVLWP